MSRMRKKLVAGEAVLAGCTGLLAILSVVWPGWIELVFRFDPDHHSGRAELLVITGLAVLSLTSGVVARWQVVRWRSLAAASGR